MPRPGIIILLPLEYLYFGNLIYNYIVFPYKDLFTYKIDISEDLISPDWPSDCSTSPSLSFYRSPTLIVPATLPLRRRQRQFTTRDDRLRVRTLLEIGWSIRATARHFDLSKD
jgi:hypothetical protein